MTIDEYAEHADNPISFPTWYDIPVSTAAGVPEMSRYRYRYSFTSFEQRVPVPSLRISTVAGVPEMSRYRYRYSFIGFEQRVPSLR